MATERAKEVTTEQLIDILLSALRLSGKEITYAEAKIVVEAMLKVQIPQSK